MSNILSIKELTERVKGNLERAFPFVWVQGEVTNLSRPGSGHVYFSLRDGECLLNCVWFRGKQRDSETFDPLTGEVFEHGPKPCLARTMRDGDRVACAGGVTVYGPRGAYQLLVELGQESGQGDLLQRLERLKRELAARGWFAEDRKRRLPVYAERVALITAPAGAAVRDFVRIAGERGVGAEIRIYPVPVQGNEAAGRVVEALRRVNAEGWAQVAVIIRGGGSLEDLWPFNDEKLAESIVGSGVPVLTGIGHEVDTSIADLAADRRAATPSHAAQLLWQERHWYAQRVDAAEESLRLAMERRLDREGQRIINLARGLDWVSPQQKLLRAQERLERLGEGLISAMTRRLSTSGGLLRQVEERLCGLAPRFATPLERVARLESALGAGLKRRLELAEHAVERLDSRLLGLDPHGPLERGYALVWQGNTLVRGVDGLQTGAVLRLSLRDGEVETRVESVKPAVMPPVVPPAKSAVKASGNKRMRKSAAADKED